ncbi:MAG: organomercurial lyase [Candidatus Hodarchaeales archaeon]
MQSKFVNQDVLIKEFYTFHIKVLKRLLVGDSFLKIEKTFLKEFKRFNYREVAATLSLLSFDGNNVLQGAIPISPHENNYRITVDGVGSGYALCAIDSLGVPFLFNAKTVIESIDPKSNTPIKIVIDPQNPEVELYSDISITTPKNIIPDKKDDEFVDVVADRCPYIGFVKDADSISEENRALMDIISFEQGINTGKFGFNPDFQVSELRAYLSSLLAIYRNKHLTDEEFIKIFVKLSKNSYLSSIPLEDLTNLIISQFVNRRLIRKVSQTNSVELTDKGKRVAEVFMI